MNVLRQTSTWKQPYIDKSIATSSQGDFYWDAQNQKLTTPLDSLGFSTPNPYITLPLLHLEKHHKQEKESDIESTTTLIQEHGLFLGQPKLAYARIGKFLIRNYPKDGIYHLNRNNKGEK